jgi:diguanylate cyclase (GGDEF)-like protein
VNSVCELEHFGKAKFDEYGRQQALDRLQVRGPAKEKPFERIVDLVKTTLNVPICAVSLIDHDRQWFRASRGLGVDQTPRSVAFCDHAIRVDEPFIVEDASLDQRFADNPLVLSEPFIRSYLGIPLKMPDGYMVGSLCVIDQRPRVFLPGEIDILKSFAALVTGELELRTIAAVDGLTNALSRTAWVSQVEAEIDRCTRHGSSLSIVMLDLDHFKRVNDDFGHDVGDLVLIKTTAAMSEVLRKHDLCGRLGGEEFAVCLMNASAEAGMALAERLRIQIGNLQFPEQAGLSCSASFGVATLKPGENLNQLLKRADEALYEAKKQGRNQVQLAYDQCLTKAA